MGMSREFYWGTAIAVVLTVAAASSAPWWWQDTPWASKDRVLPGVTGMSGGCDAYQVFTQNRWAPVGTVVRAAPNIASNRVGGYAANQSIFVDGWVHSRVAYPTNTAPWNSDIWFHVSDDSGWVSFAGVRATPVTYDPTGLSPDGGTPAVTPGTCQAAVQ